MKTDYLEEKANEIEALEAIFPDEFELIGETESGEKKFKILIYPDEQDEEEPRCLSLNVTYTPKYPEELPEYEIETIEGRVTESYYTKIKEAVKIVAEESIGMAMVFTMANVIKEELDNIELDIKRAEEEIINERRRKEEEAEQAKFLGTKVTNESFREWKKNFDAEMLKSDNLLKAQKAKELKGRLTGRGLFEHDKTLALSDNNYMSAEEVSVDVSQFDKSERHGALAEEETENKDAVWKTFGKAD